MATSRTKEAMQALLADNSTHAITPSIMRDLVESVFAPVSNVVGIGNGTINKISKFTGTSTTGDSQIDDDGTHITLPDITMGETNLGLLGAGPLDLDLSSYSTLSFRFTCPVGGTLIRSIKRKNNTPGQWLILRNMSNSTLPADNLAILMQDDPSGVYQHIHLEGRQPWHPVPALGAVLLHMDPTATKWMSTTGLNFATGKWPLVITATVANAPIASLSPVDDVTGLDGRYVDWWRLITGASTVINGIAAPLPAGSRYSRTLKITNYGTSSISLGHLAGAANEGIACPGATAFSVRRNGSANLVYDGANNLWYVDAA